MPIDGGYLSVRIKPSSDVLAKVKELYKGLGQTETDDGYEPDEAACVLQNQISELGYADYNAFETDCLMQELASRDQKMGNTVFPAIADFEKMRLIASDLLAETKTLSSGFKSISAVPTNMRIIAARLEPSGGAVSSLSQNYWSMSEEMSDWFNSNVNNTDSDFAEIHKILNTSRFLFGTARIMKILATEFSRERRDLGRGDLALEQKIVSDLAASYISKAISGLEKIASVARDILTSVGIMRRYTLGLSSTRVMCNIESARLPSGGGSLVDVIQQLGRFQDDVEKQLSQIEDHSLKILEISEGLAASKGGL
jgi:aerotaxis receptor